MDEEIREQEPVNPDDESIDDSTSEPDNPTDGEDELAKAKAEAAKFKAIAERKTKQLEKVQETLADKKPEVKPDVPSTDKMEELEFKVEHPELRDQIDLIKTLAKGRGITMSEAAKDELVLNVLKANKEQAGVSVINSNSKIAQSGSQKQKALNRLQGEGGVEALTELLQAEE